MWRWVVLWQATILLVVGGTPTFRFFTQRRQYTPAPQINCFEYSLTSDRLGRAYEKGWQAQKTAVNQAHFGATVPTVTINPLLNTNEIRRRLDNILPGSNDLVKEHAKLVQDINSLRQVVFVAPISDDHKDYEDSIFHEIIETSSTTTPRPTTPRAYKSTKRSSIPVILVGGASQRQVVKSQPLKFPKPSISLVGTSVSPLVTHPYPFVVQGTSRKPIKVCMTAMPMMYPTTRRPSLWQRLLNALIPR